MELEVGAGSGSWKWELEVGELEIWTRELFQ
jgi:hypothetical protein